MDLTRRGFRRSPELAVTVERWIVRRDRVRSAREGKLLTLRSMSPVRGEGNDRERVGTLNLWESV